uniref:Putative secreted protein n=1 Tax=Ixodes ricinus TaxID=34613 RepID=V5GJW6_IXORI
MSRGIFALRLLAAGRLGDSWLMSRSMSAMLVTLVPPLRACICLICTAVDNSLWVSRSFFRHFLSSSSENIFEIIFTTLGFLRFDSVTATARTKQRMIAKDIFIFERLNSLLQQLYKSQEYAW